MSKRVLIITYYWPPSAGSGVQRWLKFAKYLPDFGWDPVIFTPENPDFELRDESLLKEVEPQTEVLKFPIWEPYGIFRKLKGEKLGDTAKVLEKKEKSILDQLGISLRANLLVPDPRVFWVRPSVKFLKDLVDQGQFQAVITTGPPHSMHLIGRNLKRKTGIPWLADFRDPWSQWEFLDALPMMKMVRNIHKKLEMSVLKEADTITTISPTFQKDFEALAHKKIHLLTNGYDPSDMPGNWSDILPDQGKLEIVYTGVIDSIRNPIPFLEAMQAVFEKSENPVKLRFVGKVSEQVQEFIAEEEWRRAHVALEGYVSHEEVFGFYQKAHLLLLILTDTKNAKGNIPGKLFEYMATGRPILALGDPYGDAAIILKKANAGQVFAHTDREGVQTFLREFISQRDFPVSDSVVQYSRKQRTQVLAQLLDAQTDPLP
ncbi:glycosyltransferase family 4 protein [Rhodonellum sp.]|uniref:glycosyltransferase family 4 protein n=1 Tax=Rhodonellum sp. TaxID=2231180 RepID=UPI0027281924|nr:glycosyltransferase family 4 protein [Rhodonellum sp.]MDO9554312.1 glycosyltransferase family 4 protein [Rhodonellum sp.]